MRRTISSIFLTAFSAISIAAPAMFPLPKNAFAPGHTVLEPSVAEEDYFWVNEKYPSTSAFDHYGRLFAKWHECVAKEKGWGSFGDVSDGQDSFIHQRVRFWVTPKNDVAVFVLLKYRSKGSARREKPDNEKQFVAVIKYTMPNANTVFAPFEVSCEPGP